MHSVLKGVSASVLFDVLLDPDYRKKWDPYMVESYEICCLNPNTDIGYYALKAPKPLKNRDLVLIRSWLDRGTEYYVMNRSINHRSEPPRKTCIRAISYITGFVIMPLSQQSCEVTYITQSDPKGKLPVWVVNKMTQLTAPMVMTRLAKAAKDYESWKSKHNPCHKPWLFPEQMRLPRLKTTDIRPMQETQQAETIDETDIMEDDLQEDIVGEM
ncbi:hypothetical protein NP493_1150g00041 [Ridgeia piscesae]|uniref:START domain-containing protein n=1 Tax=Ridgeia piscesae TaxID=27915 RepID=A0AAD9KGS4_RIDPI|nr:hypothetical protein NP493_1150g00041 [Ridgeia piscesae]